MDKKIIHIKPGEKYRAIVISDIHGHLEHLIKMIDAVELQAEDYLIILGDYVNRGPKSYETLQYMMRLCERPKTYILKGNHESFMERPLREDDHIGEIIEFLKTDPYETLWHAFAKKSQYDFYGCDDPESFRRHLLTTFSKELKHLQERPILMYFDDFLFVHGGYHKDFSVEEDETRFLKYDFFDQESGVQDRPVIVGHFPACILRDDILSNKPYFNEHKNIITIDGGLGVKGTGELNALIIEKDSQVIKYSNQQINDFEEVVVTRSHTFEEEVPVYVHWPNKEFKIIEKGPEMTLCKHCKSNKEFRVFNGLLDETEDESKLKIEFANTFLNLEAGTRVKKYKVFSDCVLVKHNDVFGWIKRDQIE